MSGIPDYALETTFDFKFTTRSFSTGAPTTLAGTPVVDIYEDNSLTEITGAETLTVDFDGRTGLNNLRIAATAANGFESGKSYAAVITTGTVGGVSVVGEVLLNFSIERTSALRPTTAGRTLDVTAGGAAGIDWANVEGQGTVVDLSSTDINLVDTCTTNSDMRGTDSALLAASAPPNFGDLAITVTTGEVTVGTNNDKTGYSISGTKTTLDALNDIAAGDVWAVDATTQQTQGTFGQAIGDPVADTTTIYQAVATDAAGDNISEDVAAVKAETALIVADTNELQTDWADGGRLDNILDARMAEASINTTAGAVDNVTTVATTTINTDMRGTDSAALASVCTEARLSELDAATAGKMANQTDLIKTETDKIALSDAGAGVAGSVIEEVENRATPAQVNTEIVDVVSVDTISELSQGVPAATPTLFTAVMAMYMALRNKLDVDSSFKEVHNDAGTVIFKKAVSDDGTTYSEAEAQTGP